LRVRLLGTAAGGGSPQWNCGCSTCRAVRSNAPGTVPRTQSGAALSADGIRWFLLNASPDVRIQIEGFEPLLPADGNVRGTGVEGVLITNADLDHTLGLFQLREGCPLNIHATQSVRRALTEGLSLESVLSRYCGIVWHTPPASPAPLLCADGSPSGLLYEAFTLPGKPPRYMGVQKVEAEASRGNCVGYRFFDQATGGSLVFLPDTAVLTEDTLAKMQDCDALLIDGTFWSENEMELMGVGSTPAAQMGHLPVGGNTGSLAQLAALPGRRPARRIFMHINNTNPILLADSPERADVEAAGCEVGFDGMELVI